MAILRVAVREQRVCVWFVKHRAARGQFTMSGSGGFNNDVTWTWGGTPIGGFSPTGTQAGSVTMAMMSYPTWEEIRKVLGPDCRAIDWIQARYRQARD
jgi:hypothetical protein